MWRTNLRVLLVAACVIGFYTLVAHAIPQLESEVPASLSLGADATPEALASAGERVYNGAGGCTACHGLGTRAPNLQSDDGGAGTIGARCGARVPGKDCKTYLYEAMTEPNKYVVPGFEPIMPDMRRQLSDDQIWAAVAYLQSLGGEVTVTGADLKPAAGAAPAAAGPARSTTTDPLEIYAQMGCAGCHVLDGKGGAIGPPLDRIGQQSADYIRRAILVPNADTARGYEKVGGMMPAIFGQQLSGAQLEALVTYLAGRK
jgi:mono/diheme cytochrome c family protein